MISLLRRIPVPVRRAILFLAVAAIAFVSLWSHDNIEENVPEKVQKHDYMIHAGCYLVLGALALWSYGRRARPWRSRFAVAAACALYGLLMEVLQLLPVVSRSCSARDALDNLLGAAVGTLLVPVACWPEPSPHSSPERHGH